MTNVSAIVLLAFAVSLDSFSVGFTYGLRNIRIPLVSIIVIACMSAFTMLISMLAGNVLSTILPPSTASRLGGFILVLLGGWIIYQNVRDEPENLQEEEEEKVIATIEVKYFGIAINILKKPVAADIDKSGAINGREAVLLGLALSLDAFGAGLGAAMMGYSPWMLAVSIGIMSALFIKAGMGFGKKLSCRTWMHKLSFLPGILLILIGVLKW